jgi:predicted RNase H-like HicB family nuclease
MMKITAIIERNDNNFFAVTSDDVIAGCHFGGYGYSVKEAKDDFFEGIQESLETALEMGKDVPVKAEDIEVEFHYDLQSFFNYFDIINVSKLAKKAGINESKMRAYKSGAAFASEKTLKKILDTVHSVAAELSVVAL